jgi:hypothetical protein
MHYTRKGFRGVTFAIALLVLSIAAEHFGNSAIKFSKAYERIKKANHEG